MPGAAREIKNSAPGAAAELPRLLATSSERHGAPRVQDLWDNVWVFSLLVLLPSAEWTLRRLWGLR